MRWEPRVGHWHGSLAAKAIVGWLERHIQFLDVVQLLIIVILFIELIVPLTGIHRIILESRSVQRAQSLAGSRTAAASREQS